MGAVGTMVRDFDEMKKTYSKMLEFNEQQLSIVKWLCPYQKGDNVRVVRPIKYFKEATVGMVGYVTNVDWNKEYNYLLSVSFEAFPKRYFWMPAYLFRSADWVEGDGEWIREVSGYTLKVQESENKFLCKFFNKDKMESEFTTTNLEHGLDTLESLWHSYRIINRDKFQ